MTLRLPLAKFTIGDVVQYCHVKLMTFPPILVLVAGGFLGQVSGAEVGSHSYCSVLALNGVCALLFHIRQRTVLALYVETEFGRRTVSRPISLA